MSDWIREFSITLTADVDKAEVGIWCHRCLRPSGVRFPLIGMTASGVAQMGMLETCVDCEDDGAELDCG